MEVKVERRAFGALLFAVSILVGEVWAQPGARDCVPAIDPVAGQSYTLQQAAMMSASRGGRVVLFVDRDNLWAAQRGEDVLSRDGVRTVAVEAAPGELAPGTLRMIVAGRAPEKLIYPVDDLYDGAVGGKADIFFRKLQQTVNPKTGRPYIADEDPSCSE
ncbi:MAG: hypothetical protein H6980_09810 [Gammaproteobacteria bacterium]|nr:hypothetical protein [Gammaproteobacteria bacterium]